MPIIQLPLFNHTSNGKYEHSLAHLSESSMSGREEENPQPGTSNQSDQDDQNTKVKRGKSTKPGDTKNGKPKEEKDDQLTAENNYRQALRALKDSKSFLTRKNRKAAEREFDLYLSENPQSSASESEISASSKSSAATSDSDSNHNLGARKKKILTKKRTETKIKSGKLPKLLRNYESALKGLGGRVMDGTNPNDADLLTIINAFSKRGVEEALQQERKLNKANRFLPQHPIATAPNLKNNPVPSSKKVRDALQTLRDIQRALVDGSGIDGIVPYLETVGRLATAGNLDKEAFYDLLRSRVVADSTLYKEITRYQKANTSLSKLYKILSVSYQPDSGYLVCLRKYQNFNGSGLTASQFLTKLRSLCHDVVMANNAGAPSEEKMMQLIKDKTFTILPHIAPIILERLTLYYGDDEGHDEMSAFTDIFMSLKDRITLALAKAPRKAINIIDGVEYNEDNLPFQIDEENPDDETVLNQLKKLSQADLARFNNKCYKCGDLSPIQKESHKARECLLYKGDPLAYYVCSKCKSGIHLPKFCRSGPENKHLLLEKLKQLGINNSQHEAAEHEQKN